MANGAKMPLDEWDILEPGETVYHHKRTTVNGQPLMGKLIRYSFARGLQGWIVHWESGGQEKLISPRLLLAFKDHPGSESSSDALASLFEKTDDV